MCHPDLADCPDVACEELITIHCQCKRYKSQSFGSGLSISQLNSCRDLIFLYAMFCRLVKKVPCGLGAPKSNRKAYHQHAFCQCSYVCSVG